MNRLKTMTLFRSALLVAAMVTLLTSCAFHNGITTSSASISNKNFTMMKTVHGSASTMKVLGLGGLSKQALVAEARENLLKTNPPLAEGEILANITVDFKLSFIIIVSKTTVTVTADVIRFTE